MPYKDPEKARQHAAKRRSHPDYKAWRRQYYLDRMDILKAQSKVNRDNNLERLRDQDLVNAYGHGADEIYRALFIAQQGECAICRQPETRMNNSGQVCNLSVDHDHETGQIRSLLCRSCNTGIGHFKDNPMIVSLAAKYLRNHSEDANVWIR